MCLQCLFLITPLSFDAPTPPPTGQHRASSTEGEGLECEEGVSPSPADYGSGERREQSPGCKRTFSIF